MLDKFKSLIRCWDPTSTVIFANLRDIQSAVWRLHLRTAAFYHCLADQIFCRSQSLWRRKRTCITPPPSRDWPRPRPTTVTVEGTVLHWCARAMFAAGMLLVMLQVSVAVGLAIGNADPSRASITQCAASQCCVGGLCDQCRLSMGRRSPPSADGGGQGHLRHPQGPERAKARVDEVDRLHLSEVKAASLRTKLTHACLVVSAALLGAVWMPPGWALPAHPHCQVTWCARRRACHSCRCGATVQWAWPVRARRCTPPRSWG
jgi:hypothetical protein